MKIWHIYYGTRGVAGAYIDALQKAMCSLGIVSRAFVSQGYLFKTAGIIKIFFPFTDGFEYFGPGRRLLRAIELTFGYTCICLFCAILRPAVNLSLTDDYKVTWWFFCLCKWFGLKVYLTCHDIHAHDGSLCPSRVDMMKRADYVIFHNEHARQKFLTLVSRPIDRAIVVPFPCSNYDSILSPKRAAEAELYWNARLNGIPCICFLGVVRRSKGIELLIRAWRDLKDRRGFRLVIAGKWDESELLKKQAEELPDCEFEDRYLKDEEFVYLIKKAKCVVMPYLKYTHSAVLVSVLKHGGMVLVSDEGLFQEYLGKYELMFSSGDLGGLTETMERAMRMDEKNCMLLKQQLAHLVANEDQKLKDELECAFK